MGKWLTLFLSLAAFCVKGQNPIQKPDCSSKKIQDSLIGRYVTNGAKKLRGTYNHPAWQLYLDSAIAVCPNIAYVYQQKALPYIKNGDYEKAMLLDTKAAELDPRRYTAYLGFLKCILTKDYEGGLADFKKAQVLIPNGFEMDHSYLFYQGLCNLELGNYDEAEKNLREDLYIQTGGDTKKTAHFNSLFYLGVLYYEKKDPVQAKDYLKACLDQFPSHPDANYYLGLTYKAEGDTTQAGMYFHRAKEALSNGYSMNEDSQFYVYYPRQITLFEINQEL